MRKVLFYTKDLDVTSGGSLYSILTLMEGFEKKGFELKLIVNRRKEKEIKVDYPVIPLDTKLGEITFPYALRKIINKEKPEVVFSNLLTQNIALSRAKGFKNKYFDTLSVGIVRGVSNFIHFGQKWKLPYRFWIKKVYENLDCIVAVSNAVKKDLVKTFFINPEKITVIYNPFDIYKIRKLSNEELPEEHRKLFEKNKVIINVGRLSPQKRQDLLIDTFYNVKQKVGNVKLVIIGFCGVKEDYKNEELLRQKIKKLELEKEVIFLGYQQNPFKYVKRSFLYVFTSLHEGLPRAVIESLIVGTPVVGFTGEYADLTEIFKEQRDILVPYPDTNQLSEKILFYLQNKDEYEKLKIRTGNIADRFSLENSVNQYLKLIENLKTKSRC